MELSEDQLNRAAHKLCELWGQMPDHTSYGVTLLELNKHIIKSLVVGRERDAIEAIVHAVTSEQKDEVRE